MNEQERIESIRHNGGCHLKNFKSENKTYDMCLVAVSLDGEALWYVPAEFKTKEIYEAACAKTGLMLSRVPSKFLTKKICELAVASDGIALQYVPDKFKTSKICKSAAISNAQAYWYTPAEFITPEFVVEVARKSKLESISSLPDSFKKNPFYLELIKLEPELIWHIPRKALTATIGKAAIKAMGYSSTADAVKEKPELLSRLHTSLYDHDSCLNFVQSEYFIGADSERPWGGGKNYGCNTEADREKGRLYLYNKFYDTYSLPDMMKWADVATPIVKLNGYYLHFAKEDIIDIDLCKATIEGNAHIFKDIPAQFKTKEICMLAFELEPFNIEYFPHEFITPELILKAVKHSGFILQHIPDEFKTKEVCLIAVRDEGNGKIENVPTELLDKEICIAWLTNSKWEFDPLDKIPKELWDYDIFLAAVKLDGNELEKVPAEFITEEICLAAVTKDNHAAKFVPKELFTQEMAYAMVEDTALDFELIPAEVLNEEICIKAISHGSRFCGTVLGKVPTDLITQDMCDKAIDVSIWSLKDVPEQFVTFEILAHVAKDAPGRLSDNFPKRFRNKESIDKLISLAPSAETYLTRYLEQ